MNKELYEDYQAIKEKYSELMKPYELNFQLIKLAVKTLMDIAPRHRIALETIKIATEDGIRWHVEETQRGLDAQ